MQLVDDDAHMATQSGAGGVCGSVGNSGNSGSVHDNQSGSCSGGSGSSGGGSGGGSGSSGGSGGNAFSFADAAVAVDDDGWADIAFEDPNARLLASEVSRRSVAYYGATKPAAKYTVLVVDCGVKNRRISECSLFVFVVCLH
jgi:hypothetical protein